MRGTRGDLMRDFNASSMPRLPFWNTRAGTGAVSSSVHFSGSSKNVLSDSPVETASGGVSLGGTACHFRNVSSAWGATRQADAVQLFGSYLAAPNGDLRR